MTEKEITLSNKLTPCIDQAKNEALSRLLFGSTSGGLSSKLMGGNFWQGAAIGLTVSALNHVAHRMTVRSIVNARIDGQFEGTGMNPDDRPNLKSDAEMQALGLKLKEILPVLAELNEAANNPGIDIISDINDSNGINLPRKTIQIRRGSFVTYRKAAIVIGHELVHYTHYTLRYINKWKKITMSDFKLKAYSEYLAYKWEVYWGGNIKYGDKYSPSAWMEIKKQESGILYKTFGP